MIKNNKYERLQKKKARIKKKISGTPECPRLTVFRSERHFYAQIIDDTTGKTLISASSLSKDLKEEIAKATKPVEICKIVGKAAAAKAIEKNIKKVVFDRNGYLYHGRVKAIADGAREGGLKF
jgi:large subunit ribosomal protein L18